MGTTERGTPQWESSADSIHHVLGRRQAATESVVFQSTPEAAALALSASVCQEKHGRVSGEAQLTCWFGSPPHFVQCLFKKMRPMTFAAGVSHTVLDGKHPGVQTTLQCVKAKWL